MATPATPKTEAARVIWLGVMRYGSSRLVIANEIGRWRCLDAIPSVAFSSDCKRQVVAVRRSDAVCGTITNSGGRGATGAPSTPGGAVAFQSTPTISATRNLPHAYTTAFPDPTPTHSPAPI